VQGRADEFTTRRPAERKQILGKILGLERWEVYEQKARDRIGDTRGAMQRLEGWLNEVEAELARRAEREQELSAAITAAAEAAAALSGAESQWASLEQTRRELVAVQRMIDDLTRRITAAEREDAEAEQERQTALAHADEAALGAARQELAVRVEALAAIQAEADRQAEELGRLKEEAATLRGANEAMKPQADPLKQRLGILESATEPVCPTCGQTLTDDHRHRLMDGLQVEIDQRREAYRSNQTRIRDLELAAAEIDRAQAERRASLRQRSELEKRLGELEAALTHASQAAERAAALEARQLRWRQEADRDRAQRQDLELQAAASEQRLRSSAITQAELDRLRTEKRLADERVGAPPQLAWMPSPNSGKRLVNVSSWRRASANTRPASGVPPACRR
jgi:exonuclease SbcC